MKIGIDISQIVYKGTGVGRYVEEFVSALTSIDINNEYILYGNSLRRKFILNQFCNLILKKNKKITQKIIPLPPSLLTALWNRLHIVPIEFFIGKVDIFHTSDWVEPPSKCLKVTTIHDFLIYKHPKFFPKRLVENQKRRLYWVLKESRAIITDSYATKMDGINLLGIPQEKIFVVYPGIGQNFKPVSQEIIRKMLKKYSINKSYLLTVGVREPRKNLQNLLAAFYRIRKMVDLQLVIVGKLGWGMGKLPLDSDIKILGYVSDDDLPALYSGASCFVYPSFDEGFGFPVLEALACGVKVVASNIDSLEEIGGKYIFYTDPYDVKDIEQKIFQALERKTNSVESIKWAKSFSWENTAKNILKIYYKII